MRVPFSVGDLGICKQRFGRFSENPDKFRSKFVRLGLTHSHLAEHHSHSGPLLQAEYILRNTREQADGLLATNPHQQIYQGSEDAVPEHDPHGYYENCVGQARIRHYITYPSKGMKTCMVKLIYYDKV